jgi:hypothetical protein
VCAGACPYPSDKSGRPRVFLLVDLIMQREPPRRPEPSGGSAGGQTVGEGGCCGRITLAWRSLGTPSSVLAVAPSRGAGRVREATACLPSSGGLAESSTPGGYVDNAERLRRGSRTLSVGSKTRRHLSLRERNSWLRRLEECGNPPLSPLPEFGESAATFPFRGREKKRPAAVLLPHPRVALPHSASSSSASFRSAAIISRLERSIR